MFAGLNIEVEGKQNLLFPVWSGIECFVKASYIFMLAGSQICRSLKEHNLIMCKSKVQVVSLGS